MIRKAFAGLLLAGFAFSSGGCVAMVAGAGGTMVWQGGKAVSEEPVPVARAVQAALAVFDAGKITLTEKVVKKRATQLRGERSDGANVAVDLISAGEKNVRIEVRVGLGDKSAARDLLHAIKKRF